MPIGKRLLVFATEDSHTNTMVAATADWGCIVTTCVSSDEFRARIEGGGFDLVLVKGSPALKAVSPARDLEGDLLTTPLAEIEKRHILRILASTSGNKTRAARVLGIDTKTLYNKLKSYGPSAAAFRRPPKPATASLSTSEQNLKPTSEA
jgi:transcriptional regulator with GAF, ATPase, and Fis domain